jgi:hypothetical protein
MKDLPLLPSLNETVSEWYSPTRLDIPRNPRRHVAAIHDAFDLIGGVPRLAVWANENPTEFYTKVLSKGIEKQSSVEHSGEIVVRSSVPRTSLDGPFLDAEIVDGD